MKKFLFILAWVFSLVLISVYVNENPEKIDNVKDYFNKYKKPELVLDDGGEIQRQPGNSFIIEFSKVISLSEKTAFIVHDENIKDFNQKYLKIYTQNGYVSNNLKFEKLKLPKSFNTSKSVNLTCDPSCNANPTAGSKSLSLRLADIVTTLPSV